MHIMHDFFSAHTNIAYESLSCCLFSSVGIHEDRCIEKGYTSNNDVVEVGAG